MKKRGRERIAHRIVAFDNPLRIGTFNGGKWACVRVKKEVQVTLRVSMLKVREHELIEALEEGDSRVLPVHEKVAKMRRKVHPGNCFGFESERVTRKNGKIVDWDANGGAANGAKHWMEK